LKIIITHLEKKNTIEKMQKNVILKKLIVNYKVFIYKFLSYICLYSDTSNKSISLTSLRSQGPTQFKYFYLPPSFKTSFKDKFMTELLLYK